MERKGWKEYSTSDKEKKRGKDRGLQRSVANADVIGVRRNIGGKIEGRNRRKGN